MVSGGHTNAAAEEWGCGMGRFFIWVGCVGVIVLMGMVGIPSPLSAQTGTPIKIVDSGMNEQDLSQDADSDLEGPVFLYFGNADFSFLKTESRAMSRADTPLARARQIVEGLISGPGNELTRTLPEGTTLNAIYLADNGIAYVDFSRQITDNHPGGVNAEYLTVFSVVNSLVLNISDIRKVKILVGGREADTLAGHINIQEPFAANMVLVR